MVFDVFHFHKVFQWIKDSRWRKKCKSLIKRAMTQLLVQKNRRESIVKQSQADIAQLLKFGHVEDALARVEQLHTDQCILSAYEQIEIFCNCVYSNVRGIGRHRKLCDEVNEAASSLVFAASRCGELPELRRLRTLFNKNFGKEFERINMELQPGNFVNPKLKYNLGNNSVPDDVRLQLTSQIAQINEQNNQIVPQQPPQQLDYNNAPKKDESMGGSKIKDGFWRIGSNLMLTIGRDSYDGSSDGSPYPIQETAIVYLDDDVEEERLAIKGDAITGNRDGFCQQHDEIEDEEDEDKPRLSYVHPKLPDYDELVATFTEYKRKSI